MPVVGGDDQIGDVRVGVEEGEGLLEQAVRVVGEPVAGGDERVSDRPLVLGRGHDSDRGSVSEGGDRGSVEEGSEA